MNKRILIYGTVICLVMLSFTTVVGFNEVTSDSETISPLFGLRTSRVVNNQDILINSDYIGKEKEIDILLPARTHIENVDYGLYTATCGPDSCPTWSIPDCITTGSFCDWVTTGPICKIIILIYENYFPETKLY